jgi:hypothetical protein
MKGIHQKKLHAINSSYWNKETFYLHIKAHIVLKTDWSGHVNVNEGLGWQSVNMKHWIFKVGIKSTGETWMCTSTIKHTLYDECVEVSTQVLLKPRGLSGNSPVCLFKWLPAGSQLCSAFNWEHGECLLGGYEYNYVLSMPLCLEGLASRLFVAV